MTLQVPSRGALASRFGAFGELLHDYANGINHREVHPPGEAKSISREMTFQEDSRDRSFLLAVLRRQSEKVGEDLRDSRKQSRCIGIKVRYSDFTTVTRHRTLSASTDTNQTIFGVGADLLTKALSTKGNRSGYLGSKSPSWLSLVRSFRFSIKEKGGCETWTKPSIASGRSSALTRLKLAAPNR